MDTANSPSVSDQQLKSIGEQKRIAQLEHKIASVSKQLDEKGTKLKETLEQNASLKDRIGTLEQEKLEVSLLIETLTKSRDRLLQEKDEQRAKIVDELGAQNAAEDEIADREKKSNELIQAERRRCFFDIHIDGEPVGRIVMELFDELVSRTTEFAFNGHFCIFYLAIGIL